MGLQSPLDLRQICRCNTEASKHVQPQHAAACRSTRFLELHIGVWKRAAACRSMPQHPIF